jgi:hypothetical protein
MIDNAVSARRGRGRWTLRPASVVALVALAVVAGWSIRRMTRPPAPVGPAAPDTAFSAARALHHDSVLAQRPHPAGSAEHARVRDYLVASLAALQLEPQVQTVSVTGTRYRAAGEVDNVLARVPGRAPDGPAVLLVAHYDGVRGSPAAADDGAGVAAVLETLRAIRARREPLAHDVIALFTDREGSGLLGAAAFAQKHPWAKDVAFIVNLEARGTRGRSMMFETGPGNLDAVRMLRRAGDVTAGSVFTTLYHMLPNDTDLSELATLGRPALNFAFLDGAQWYHSPSDDLAHLDAGSVQHHGQQMLAVVTAVANGALPRPTTGDAVFFDFPGAGLVIYPLWMAIPLLGLAVILVASTRPPWRDVLVGAAAMIGCVAVLTISAKVLGVGAAAGSAPAWSGARGWLAGALAVGVVLVDVAIYVALTRRWPRVHDGAVAAWLVLAAVTTFAAPATSYLFVWPVLFAAAAARSRQATAEWVAAAFTLMLLAGVVYAAAAILLGLSGLGVMVLVAFTSLIGWLIAPALARSLGCMDRG